MSAIPVWAPPYEFDLTNPYSGTLRMNVFLADRAYLIDGKASGMIQAVRATVDHVPQADGDILHKRFLTGVQIRLVVELWENENQPACAELLTEMMDEFTGSFRSILNAGDNVGRLAWEVPGQNARMLDDARLLVYPSAAMGDVLTTMTVTIDSQYPYAEDLTQQETIISDGGSVVIDNTGNAEHFPVYKVSKSTGTASFVLSNTTTGEALVYGGTSIPAGSYAELDSFRNTIFLNGDGADLLNGVDIQSSLFPKLIPGGNTIEITGADVDVLWNPSWG